MTSSGSNIAICTNSTFGWSFNSLNQSPCQVASYLGGVCNAGLFNVPPLDPGSVYLGPTTLNTNACRCSSVFYSLISACSLCQNRDYLKWSSYIGNCTAPSTEWLEGIPSGTKVPHWAYLNVAGVDDSFNPLNAAAAGDSPESSATGPTATGPTSTSLSRPASGTATGSGTSHTSGSSSSSSSSKAGPIAGGVVGGVVALALIAALVFWLIRRRRNRLAPSSIVGAGSNAPSNTPMGYNNSAPVTTAPFGYNHAANTGSTTYNNNLPSPKLYDPADPSTFPSATPSPFAGQQESSPFIQHQNSGNFNGFSQPQHQPGRYTGAPEI